ncbi:hypothetical protein KRR39_01265 [Nocardioides panacis]|uniref:Uncharacterized protein n=1 Tax=Nocardioides panacis TaxID=2849501 RepID=A0A975SYX0_9ACTN|nr:hypothetical protein [Nocardioides panacis]QWZ08533.1 hypothetical protein KRR39_01265 [Nocardioides panacis]
MTPLLITWVLTVLAAVVVVLTRVRLSREDGDAAGRIAIPKAVLHLHTIAGVPALVVWVAFLLTGTTVLGVVGLLLWWVTVVAGLLVLARWLPAKGRHSSGPATDSWGEGPGLSVLAHVGLLVGTVIWTVFLALDKIP